MQTQSVEDVFEPSKITSPELKFLAGMIIRAILDMLPTEYEKGSGHRAPGKPRQIYSSAFRWTRNQDNRPPSMVEQKVNFNFCCNELKIEPRVIRKFISDLLSEKISQETFIAQFRHAG